MTQNTTYIQMESNFSSISAQKLILKELLQFWVTITCRLNSCFEKKLVFALQMIRKYFSIGNYFPSDIFQLMHNSWCTMVKFSIPILLHRLLFSITFIRFPFVGLLPHCIDDDDAAAVDRMSPLEMRFSHVHRRYAADMWRQSSVLNHRARFRHFVHRRENRSRHPHMWPLVHKCTLDTIQLC